MDVADLQTQAKVKNLYLRAENFTDMKAKVAFFRRVRKIAESEC